MSKIYSKKPCTNFDPARQHPIPVTSAEEKAHP